MGNYVRGKLRKVVLAFDFGQRQNLSIARGNSEKRHLFVVWLAQAQSYRFVLVVILD